MRISYAITVCNELEEIKRLVELLQANKREEDEIVILWDKANGEGTVCKYLMTLDRTCEVFWGEFKGHFADWKNLLTSHCTGDYIFNIDADEYVSEDLIYILPYLLEENPQADMFLVPRINTVEGITQEHINKWGWRVDENGWINFPDHQQRLYRNRPEIKWVNKVHEVLYGYTSYMALPPIETYCLRHPKTILKQEKQNSYYDQL